MRRAVGTLAGPHAPQEEELKLLDLLGEGRRAGGGGQGRQGRGAAAAQVPGGPRRRSSSCWTCWGKVGGGGGGWRGGRAGALRPPRQGGRGHTKGRRRASQVPRGLRPRRRAWLRAHACSPRSPRRRRLCQGVPRCGGLLGQAARRGGAATAQPSSLTPRPTAPVPAQPASRPPPLLNPRRVARHHCGHQGHLPPRPHDWRREAGAHGARAAWESVRPVAASPGASPSRHTCGAAASAMRAHATPV
jgi:hypothetical protein